MLIFFKAGAISGMVVDAGLFPLDTLKTRLQSASGFSAAGGFHGLYAGLSSTLIGSAPGAALFFVTYEAVKRSLAVAFPSRKSSPLVFLAASCLAEGACTIRVPMEVLKQRMQVFQYQPRLFPAVAHLYRSEGILGFYRGFQATLLREIPFAAIQFPVYEYLKIGWCRWQQIDESKLQPWRAALCGSVAGAIAAALTTPLDVLKTRTMLSRHPDEISQLRNPWYGAKKLWNEGGLRKLFAGAGPRMLWISVGGFIFFGTYEKSKKLIVKWTPHT